MKMKVLLLMGTCNAWRPHMVGGWERRTEGRSGEEKGQEEKRGKKETPMGQRFWGFRAISNRYLIRILNGKGFIFIFCLVVYTHAYTHICVHARSWDYSYDFFLGTL